MGSFKFVHWFLRFILVSTTSLYYMFCEGRANKKGTFLVTQLMIAFFCYPVGMVSFVILQILNIIFSTIRNIKELLETQNTKTVIARGFRLLVLYVPKTPYKKKHTTFRHPTGFNLLYLFMIVTLTAIFLF